MPSLPDLPTLERAAALVYRVMPPTPLTRPPALAESLGVEVWVKHENRTPIGAFKARGGVVYADDLLRHDPRPRGLVAATRGNHGQSVALAAREAGLPAAVVVPHGNSVTKNAAMRALGAELIEHGEDFQAAMEHAARLAAERGWELVPSFDARLVAGVGTYALELFRDAPPLDAVFVPIGLGSGACGVLSARNALSPSTQVVGVVSDAAPAYLAALATGEPRPHPVAPSIADGMSCRTPDPDAVALLRGTPDAPGLARAVPVSDDDIGAAMRLLHAATGEVAEGAGAAALAALAREADAWRGRRVAVILTGGNIDPDVLDAVLSARDARATPSSRPSLAPTALRS